MAVTLSKNIKIGYGHTDCEPLTSYFLSTLFFNLKLQLSHL